MKYLQLFFEQVMGSYFKNKYIKTAQINLREWQKWQQLLILYINIVTLWCYSWESRIYSNNYIALTSMGNLQLHTNVRTHADILCNSINLLYYKFGICIYQKYQHDTYITTVYTKVVSTININQIWQGHILIPKPLKCL